MAKRVGVVLSGCGNRDGSEIRETVLALLSLERAGWQPLCCAPDVPFLPVDHRAGTAEAGSAPRSALAEAARLARGEIRLLSEVTASDVDALLFPGGAGVATVLSNYAEKEALCDVHPDVVRLLRTSLAAKKPMGFICLAPILAARVLGPVAGVRITLGGRAGAAAKHAAVMGADVRPCLLTEVIIDQKNRVVSTPAYMYDDAPLPQVAHAIERLVRSMLSLVSSRGPRPPGPLPARGSQPGPRPPSGPGPALQQANRPSASQNTGPRLRRTTGAD